MYFADKLLNIAECVSSVSSPQPKLVSSWLFCINALHAVTLPCPANCLTVSQPVTAWKAGNVESLGNWCLKWRSTCTPVSLQTTIRCPHANLTEPVGCAYGFLRSHGQRSCRKPLPQHCMKVISYGLPMGLHMPSKSYGPGQPVDIIWI